MANWAWKRAASVVLAALAVSAASAQDLRGHGGPVRAILISGTQAVTAGFDTSIIRWDLQQGTARQVLRFHDGAVNALVLLPTGGIASAGEDGRIALWDRAGATPQQVLEGHAAPVAALALSRDGAALGSASWDGTARLWRLGDGDVRIFTGHRGPVNGVAVLDDETVATAGYDGTLRLNPPNGAPTIIDLGVPLNALVLAQGELVIAGGDGTIRFVDPVTGQHADVAVAEVPIVALAVSRDGTMVAAAGLAGALALIDRGQHRIVRKLAGPAFPVWSLAFSSDGKEIFTGGADRLVRRWRVLTGEPVNPILAEALDPALEALGAHPGAEIFRACSACHALSDEGANRAGPSLYRIMGRAIASRTDYGYSPGFGDRPIIWSRETIAKLFEIGPNAYVPGTKMPEQKISNAADREALVDFLDKAAR